LNYLGKIDGLLQQHGHEKAAIGRATGDPVDRFIFPAVEWSSPMRHVSTLALALAVAFTGSALANGKGGGGKGGKGTDNTKILAEIQKLQGEIQTDNAKRQVELTKATTHWDGLISKKKNEEGKDSAILKKLKDDKQAAIDQINNAYAQARMQYVNTDAQLKEQRAQLIAMRDSALEALSGDAYQTTLTSWNVKIAAVDAKIVANRAAWRAAHDKRIKDVDTVAAQFDAKISKEQALDTKATDQLNQLSAHKKKALDHINAHHDKHVAALNAKIEALKKKLK